MEKFLIYILKEIDYFSTPMQLSFRGERNFGTLYGGIMTIIIFAVVLYLTINNLSDLFNRKNPNTTMISTYYENAQILNMNKTEMFYVTAFYTSNFTPFYDPSYFSFKFFHFEVFRDSNSTTKITELPYVNCTEYKDYYKGKGLEEYFKTNMLDQGFCYDVNGISLGGSFTSQYYSNVFYQIEKCQNSTDGSGVVCQSDRVINEKLNSGYFEFFYIEKNIDISNYSQPFTYYFKSFFILIDSNMKKLVDIYIKNVTISSDVGLMFTQMEYNSTLTFDYDREQIATSSNDGILIQFHVNSSNNMDSYQRIYLKLQDIAAIIGGLLQMLVVIGQFIAYHLSQLDMYEYMINILFYINNQEEEKRQKYLKKVKTHIFQNKRIFTGLRESAFESISAKNKLVNNYIQPSASIERGKSSGHYSSNLNLGNNKTTPKFSLSPDQQVINNDNNSKIANTHEKMAIKLKLNEKISEFKQKLNKKYRLNAFNFSQTYIMKCCNEKHKKKYLYLKVVMDKLTNYLDYMKIIKSLQEFRKIKKILFTKNQRNLFSAFNVQAIDEKKIKSHFEKKQLKEVDMNEIDYADIYSSYLIGKDKSGSNKYYRKLMENFDVNLKVVFDNLD